MAVTTPAAQFEDLGLEPSLVRALHKRGFQTPTPVQAMAVPKALEGRDVVARARTGSGKTLAYLLPLFHRILTSDGGKAGWQALILVPTRELAEQIRTEAAEMAAKCGEEITATAMLSEGAAARAAAARAGQIVVSTPARIAALMKDRVLVPKLLERTLRTLVLDEADLLLSYGYEKDVAVLAPAIPRACQCILMSATTSEDVDRITKLVLQNPISLDLLASSEADERDGGTNAAGQGSSEIGIGGGGVASEVDHRKIVLPAKCRSDGKISETTEKLLHLLTLLRLNLVGKKVLVFVNSPETAMRVRLFLDAFGIRVAMLSADQPLNSRHHVLQEFNRGLFDYLVATDDIHGNAPHPQQESRVREERSARKPEKRRRPFKDPEFGVTRGIDFKGVRTVINFDLPDSSEGYVHRVGRTGRAGQSGIAITLVSPSEKPLFESLVRLGMLSKQAPTGSMTRGGGEGALTRYDGASKHKMEAEEDDGGVRLGREKDSEENELAAKLVKDFEGITTTAVEGLRYRAEDVARSITKNVIREARTKDIKSEILNSKKLQSFFEERPGDLALLRHDRSLRAHGAAGAAAPHLKHVPAYLRDPSLQGESFVGDGRRTNLEGHLPLHKRRKTSSMDPIKGFVRAPKRGGDKT